MTKNFKKGTSLVEVIIAAAVILLVLSGLYTTHIFFLKTILRNIDTVKANFLMEEGIEAVKTIRDSDWVKISSLIPGTNYRLTFNSSVWATTTSVALIENRFDRVFSVEEVYREVDGDITESGGTLDEGTMKLNVSVSWWNGVSTTTKSTETYISNL